MRPVLPSLPDHDILLDIPHLRGGHQPVHDPGAESRGMASRVHDSGRLALCIFRGSDWPATDLTSGVPSRVATPTAKLHADGMLLDVDERISQPVDVSGGRHAIGAGNATPGGTANEFEAGEEMRTVNRRGSYSLNVAVAVHMPQVRQVHGVLRDLLHMTAKPNGPDFQIAPVVSDRRLFRQMPLRRAAGASTRQRRA